MDKVLDIKTETVDKVTYLIMNSELMETFGDIVGELYMIAPDKKALIYDLGDLLREEVNLITPLNSYDAWVNAKKTIQSITSYEKEISQLTETMDLFAKRNRIYNELIDLLGDRSGLVTEFVDNYRACNFMLFSLINC